MMKFAITVALYFILIINTVSSDELQPADVQTSNDDSEDVVVRSGLATGAANVKVLNPLQPQALLVECYVCNDCPKVVPYNTTRKLCPYTPDVQKQGRCVTYSERYNHIKRPWYIRGCASERGTCSDIRNAHEKLGTYVQLLSCRECKGDKCNTNAAPRSVIDITIVFISLTILPVLGKYTLA